tara:strand:+ start:98 stop:580 length:483 start_codon:yes stop_codon:yes gene_type:complete
MPKFLVFKAHLTKVDRDIVNGETVRHGGWGATPKLAAYAAVSHSIGSVSEVDVLAATIHRVYVHGITAMADSVEQMFEYDNAPWGCEAVQPSYHAKGLRSLSVGDLVMEIPCDGNEGHSEATLHVCEGIGWVKLSKRVHDAFCADIPTLERKVNALEEAA